MEWLWFSGSEVSIKRLHDLAGDGEGVRCAIIGTIYKKQELKPSILKEISEEVSHAFLLCNCL